MERFLPLNATLLSAHSRLFSATVFREMAEKGKSALFARLVNEIFLTQLLSNCDRVGDIFEAAFDVLRRANHRDEYVYKSALTQKVLLGTHSLSTASMVTEFRVADCKADLAILNGTSTVYEIKSERDSLTRLTKQIATYQKFFASVVVIAGENHLDAVLRLTSSDVGVMVLSERHQISNIRNAVNRPDQICPLTVFDSIRMAEAVAVLGSLGVKVPVLPNTLQRAAVRKLFAEISPFDLHSVLIPVLKKSRDLSPLSMLVCKLPKSLWAAALSIPLKKSGHCNLLEALDSRVSVALNWK